MRNYRDLVVWEKAHRLTLEVYRATHVFPNHERFSLTSQVRRASASIAANLAEGCGRRSDREMGRFVQIAMGSGSELSYHLLLSRDLGYLNATDFDRVTRQLDEVMRMLSAFSARLKATRQLEPLELTAKG